FALERLGDGAQAFENYVGALEQNPTLTVAFERARSVALRSTDSDSRAARLNRLIEVTLGIKRLENTAILVRDVFKDENVLSSKFSARSIELIASFFGTLCPTIEEFDHDWVPVLNQYGQ